MQGRTGHAIDTSFLRLPICLTPHVIELRMNLQPTPSPPDHGCIDTQVVGNILLIGINRPAKRNGWTPVMFRQLAEAYTRLDDEPGLRIGVLHAFGEHFTAGLDMPAIQAHLESGEAVIPEGLVEPHDFGKPGYRRRTKPVVAAVKGICFTVGIELMLGADIVIAGEDCRFSQKEVQRGLMPGGGATLRMAQRAGLGNAMMLLLTGDDFDAPTAYRLNFVQKLVPNDQVLAEAIAIAQRIAEQAPLAVQATRLNTIKAVEEGPAAAVADFQAIGRRIFASEDWAEGVRSFVEKRKAVFKGR